MENIDMAWETYKICMDINFEYYKIFYYVGKYGNFTRAAAALGSSQPNVTRIIKLLEAQLGCRLFLRGPRGITLTGEGEKLYAHVREAYRHLICAQEELSSRVPEDAGTIEIGATETALHLFLLDALKDFKKKYPRIRIKVHNHNTPEIMRQLAGGGLDFAAATTPFEVPEGFACETVWNFREILVGGAQYRRCGGEAEPREAGFGGCLTGKAEPREAEYGVRPPGSSPAKVFSREADFDGTAGMEELAGYPWVGLGRGTATYDLYRDFFREHHMEIELDMEVATSDLMLPLIRNNLGIGFVPESLALPLLQKNALVRIPLGWEAPMRSIQLVVDRGRGKSRAADTFYRYLTEAGRKRSKGTAKET